MKQRIIKLKFGVWWVKVLCCDVQNKGQPVALQTWVGESVVL